MECGSYLLRGQVWWWEVCVGGLSVGHVKLERPAQAEVHESFEGAQDWRLHLRTAGVFLVFKATRLHEVTKAVRIS